MVAAQAGSQVERIGSKSGRQVIAVVEAMFIDKVIANTGARPRAWRIVRLPIEAGAVVVGQFVVGKIVEANRVRRVIRVVADVTVIVAAERMLPWSRTTDAERSIGDQVVLPSEFRGVGRQLRLRR